MPPPATHAGTCGLPSGTATMGSFARLGLKKEALGLLRLASKVPVVAVGVVELVGSIVSQYRNAAMMSAGAAPFAVQGTTPAKSPGPLMQGTPLKLMVAVGLGPSVLRPPTPPTT